MVCVITILLFVQGVNEKLRAQVIVDSKLGQSEILIGEQTTLTTTVTANKTQHVIFPNYIKGDTWRQTHTIITQLYHHLI